MQDKQEDAEKYMAAVLSAAIKGFGTDHPHTAGARQHLGALYCLGHKYELAIPLYEEVGLLRPPVLLRQ